MAGEKSGNLAGTIGRYIQYAGTIARTKSKIRSALVYPTLLIVFSFILLTILINFILPRFAAFYKDFQSEMPALTTASSPSPWPPAATPSSSSSRSGSARWPSCAG